MENENYLKDIQDIKVMMSKSSQFLSLSGLSGILAGIFALIGAYFANRVLTTMTIEEFDEYRNYSSEDSTVIKLIGIAILVIVASIIIGIILSSRKAKKQNENLWNETSKRVLIQFGTPLITGGIFALLILQKEIYILIAPITLLFYGLSCINASRNTFRDIKYLGITMVVLGLLSAYFSGYGLLFWTIGFGFCHIIYGSIMYFKYDRN
ncbi:MAG: hypothetical protein ACI9XR_000891 [Flavobacterium sp.]|jgi:hypothetical protein